MSTLDSTQYKEAEYQSWDSVADGPYILGLILYVTNFCDT
jgi:hypothetical protein